MSNVRSKPGRLGDPFRGLDLSGGPGDFMRRFALLAGMILALLAFGTVGFVVTEGTSVWDGFVWSVDTIATIGSIPSPENEAAQVLKLLLIVFGVGTLFYALVTVTEFFVAGQFGGLLSERQALRMIESLSDHFLICGFGRVGRQAARDLNATGAPFVIIDVDPPNRDLAKELGAPFLEGSASEDEMLAEAGVERARGVIACVDSDAENIAIVLSARELNSELIIVARASTSATEKKLHRAGADRVISPYKTSGTEMARLAIHPQVPFSIEVAPEYRMEQIEVAKDCAGAGKAIGELRGAGLIVAVHREGGEVELEPGPEVTVSPSDVVVAVGDDEAMDELESRFAPAGAETAESHPGL